MGWFKRKKKEEGETPAPATSPPPPPPSSPTPPPSTPPVASPIPPPPPQYQPPETVSLDVCSTCRGVLNERGECDYCKCVEQINSAEHLMVEASDSGIIVSTIEPLLENARKYLSMRDFNAVERIIIDLEDALDTLKVTYNQCQRQIATAQNAINNAKDRYDTSQATNVLHLAKSLMKTGHYEKALQFAVKAEKLVRDIEGRKEITKAELEMQMPKTEVGTREMPVCPSCRNILRGRVAECEYCHTPIIYDERGFPRPPKKPTIVVPEEVKVEEKNSHGASFASLNRGEKKIEPVADSAYQQALEEIKKAEEAVEDAGKAGADLTQCNRMLDFARAFFRGKNYEKAVRYAYKTVESAKEEMSRKS